MNFDFMNFENAFNFKIHGPMIFEIPQYVYVCMCMCVYVCVCLCVCVCVYICIYTHSHTYNQVADLAEVEADNLVDGEGISCNMPKVFFFVFFFGGKSPALFDLKSLFWPPKRTHIYGGMQDTNAHISYNISDPASIYGTYP